MSSRKKSRPEVDREADQMLKEGAEVLALEMEDLLTKECDLLMQAALHRMCQEGFTYAEAWADIGQAVLKAHTARNLFRNAYQYRKEIEEHSMESDQD